MKNVIISYCDIQNNGGGIHLIYDRDKKILRGFYSHWSLPIF